MNKRARMIDLAGELLAPEALTNPPPPVPEPPKVAEVEQTQASTNAPRKRRASPLDAIELERPYGERGDFEKITVTLPSEVRALLLDESNRRKKKRSSDWPITVIVREALASYLMRKGA